MKDGPKKTVITTLTIVFKGAESWPRKYMASGPWVLLGSYNPTLALVGAHLLQVKYLQILKT